MSTCLAPASHDIPDPTPCRKAGRGNRHDMLSLLSTCVLQVSSPANSLPAFHPELVGGLQVRATESVCISTGSDLIVPMTSSWHKSGDDDQVTQL